MPTVDHAPETTLVNNPCSCCCINMGCRGLDGVRAFPNELAFIASIAGSCGVTQSGIATLQQPDPSTRNCEYSESLGCNKSALCGCRYEWDIADADIPTCGPYIESVSLVCFDPIVSPIDGESVFGRIVGCDHLRYEKCYWFAIVTVARAAVEKLAAPGCPISIPHPTPRHPVQDCGTCEWSCVDGAGAPVCCDTCPPCYDCHPCPAGVECCGVDGCGPCTLPECLSNPCNRCFLEFGGSPTDPSCENYCSAALTITRRYAFYLTDCPNPDNLKGCNPTSCPPDDKNTGDFYLYNECSPTEYVQFACSAELLASMTAARRVAALTKAELDAALIAQLSLGA